MNGQIIVSNNIINICKKALLVVAGALVLSLSSHIYIPTYPVPFTMQSLMVLFIGYTLGSRLSVYSVLAYIAGSIVGLPLIGATIVGLAVFTLPSFGYIIGFIFAAYIAGLAKNNGRDKKIITTILPIVVAHQIIFVFGVLYLSYFLGSLRDGFIYGYLPFMGFDAIKITIAVLGINVISRFRNTH
ncbi:MAG: biotin transporter BioY [Alphaproteobacteria bacterium]|jgi:biotin transport system substrate-specific component|nr:biotin transporter BioY [Alphaproteobacteria bacterium]